MTNTKAISQAQFDAAQRIRQLRDELKASPDLHEDADMNLCQRIAYKRALKHLDTAWRTMLEAST